MVIRIRMNNEGIVKGTVIKTYRGPVLVEHLKINDLVLVSDGGYDKVTEIKDLGFKDTWRLNFRDVEHITGAKTINIFNSYWSINSRVRTVKMADLSNLLKKKHFQGYLPLPKEDSHPGTGDVLPIAPYILGVLLGDGSFRYRTPFLVCDDKEILDEITALLPSGHELKNVKMNGRRDIFFRIVGDKTANLVSQGVNELGLKGSYSWNKTIPKVYMCSSPSDRLSLVQGLMDSDGTSEIKRGVSFCTTSKKLAEQMCTLIRSLGGDCRITTKVPSYTYKEIKKEGRIAYIVTIRIKEKWKLFKLPRKMIRVLGKDTCSDILKRRLFSITRGDRKMCYSVVTESSNGIVLNDYVVLNDVGFKDRNGKNLP